MFERLEYIKKLIDMMIYIHSNHIHLTRPLSKNVSISSKLDDNALATTIIDKLDQWFVMACHDYVGQPISENTIFYCDNSFGSGHVQCAMHSSYIADQRGIAHTESEITLPVLDFLEESSLFQYSTMYNDYHLFFMWVECAYHDVLPKNFYMSLNATKVLGMSVEDLKESVNIIEQELNY